MEWKVSRYCGIGRASIIVILLIRHRFAKKMSMKSMILSSELCQIHPDSSTKWNGAMINPMNYMGTY